MASLNRNQERTELVDKLVGIRRVAKTVKGGRRMSFSAIVVVGDEGGRVGWGKGKAREVPDAVRKGTDEAKRGMVRVPMRHGRTIHHAIEGRFGAARVILKPAVPGTGIIAGGPMRAVFEAMGMKDIVAKSLGSNNPFNLIQATFNAFAAMQTPRGIAAKRGIKASDLVLYRQEAAKGDVDSKEESEKAAAKAKESKKVSSKKPVAKAKNAKKSASKKSAAKKSDGKPSVETAKKADAVKAAAKVEVKADVAKKDAAPVEAKAPVKEVAEKKTEKKSDAKSDAKSDVKEAK